MTTTQKAAAAESTTAAEVRRAADAAREASLELARIASERKDQALRAMAEALRDGRAELQKENEKDLEAGREKGLSSALLDRLRLSDRVIGQMAAGLDQIAEMPDPVGSIAQMQVRPNGLRVGKMRIPIGVIGIIYESRPNVTADAAGLCLKAGNAVVLRGGSEAVCSNRAIAARLREGLAAADLPEGSVELIGTVDRAAVEELLRLDELIDLVIPRGGEGLIRFVVENSRIPVIQHYKGVCHTYVDRDADEAMATAIVVNGKVQRPAVCNAIETLLVHRDGARRLLPRIGRELTDRGVELRACALSSEILDAIPHSPACEEDWSAEYLDLVLAVRTVGSFAEAVEHIQTWGSTHTETIVTRSYERAMRFLREVNSSCVLVNASTRFADGYELGLGAEIGISTSKLHAFGPMGVRELTCEKFVVLGDGQIRE